MTTPNPKQDKAARRDADIRHVGVQLHEWHIRLDELAAGYLSAGAYATDPYRLRIEALRERQGVVQAKLDALNATEDVASRWGAFRSDIREDWAALQLGFKDLTVTPVVPAPVSSTV